uniref:Protein-lysine methyltransferase METTL21D n=1 Tax=Steinernema glaseri TaxID=37863 RepID=A0A1I7YN04_9BILA
MTEFVRELSFGDVDVVIHQESLGDVNCVVWDAALCCCFYFAKSAFSKDFKVLELGAGTAVCSVALASMGCQVEATDLPACVPLMEKNIAANQEAIQKAGGTCVAKSLDWNEPLKKRPECDLLLLVDCIYYVDSIGPLIDTIRSVDAKRILCAYEVRDSGQPVEAQRLFMELVKKHFDIRHVPEADLDPDYRSPDILLMDLVPKIDSV